MDFAKHQDPKTRLAGIGFVVLLHALLIWGLVSGLARKVVELLPEPIETKIIQEIQFEREPPPPPKPEIVPPPQAFVPPPDIIISTPPPPNAITSVTNVPQPDTTQITRVGPTIDFANSPRGCREPEYPSTSRRLGEEGVAEVSLLIGVDGKVQQSRIDKSSKFARLDEATIRSFSKCKFKVGSNSGQPEAAWFSTRYRWILKE